MTAPVSSSETNIVARSPSIIPDNLTPHRIIDFGRAEWQAHLGGSFHGAEEHAGVPQNWAGAGRCWCILTGLDPTCDHAVRLDAAPFAPFGTELQEVRLITRDGRTVLHRVVPASATELVQQLRIPPTTADLEFQWRRLGTPQLTVTINDHVSARLQFESRPDLQTRDFLIRRDLLADNSVLAFDPNFSIKPESLEGNPETRVLSFRFFRLTLFKLP